MDSQKTIEIPSRRYGKYLVRSKIGAGGMAEVFLAEVVDESGDQLSVALKMMKEGMNAEAFAGEADLMGMLSHPNLVQRLEVGQAFGRPFIAMEFLIGGDLQQVMRTHRQQMKGIPPAIAVYVVLETLKALAYFHNAKTRTGSPLMLVHGDVNPSNMFFGQHGEVKLGDFGVAKSAQRDLGPADGVAAGKLHYLSPEQTRGDSLTPASDLFTLGIVLHELTVGYHPFLTQGGDPKSVMSAIRAAKLNLPDYVDRPLANVLRRALQPEINARFRTAGEFAGHLFHYALDGGLLPQTPQVEQWLEEMLGLLS